MLMDADAGEGGQNPQKSADVVYGRPPTDPKFLASKDLNPFKTVSKAQEDSSILKVVFAFSK